MRQQRKEAKTGLLFSPDLAAKQNGMEDGRKKIHENREVLGKNKGLSLRRG
jgi:hypothetical protein